MLLDVGRSLLVVGCISAGFIISAGPGLVARAAEPDRWVGSLSSDPAAVVARERAAQRRIAELEQRVRELEAQQLQAQSGTQPQAGESPSQLAAALAQHEELKARHLALLEHMELQQSRASKPAAAPPSDADPRAQLRYWAKIVRDGETDLSRVSPEWSSAIGVLLRPERSLDPRNPWREH